MTWFNFCPIIIGAISYVTRESKESKDPSLGGKFPVFVIEKVNHAQVASGEIPDVVIANDIPAEIDNDEAFNRYAKATIAFMVINTSENFLPEVIAENEKVMMDYQIYTDSFLNPFQQMRNLEHSEDGKESKWIIEAQKILSGTVDSDAITVTNEIVAFSDLGECWILIMLI